jgi:hypothetical protein
MAAMDDDLQPTPETAPRWALVALVVLVVMLVGLIAYVRGPDHHRGDDVGALGRTGATGGEPVGMRARR